MSNIIVMCVILVLVILAIAPTLKHFKGQGGCCGGGGYTPKKKKLNKVIGKKAFHVEGMHCEHCKNRVMEAVNDIPGLSAKVNLKRGIVMVSYDSPPDDEEIRARIERAGYTVKKISRSRI